MMKLLKRIFSCLILSLLIALILVGTILWQSYRFWWQQPGDEALEITIESGQGLSAIADELHEQNLIASAFWFKAYAKLTGEARNLKAGTFYVERGDNYSSIIKTLLEAEDDEVTITIPEGYTLAQIGEVVTAGLDITSDEWVAATGPDSPFETSPIVVAAQKPDSADLEGYLFPDTYRFFRDATAEDVVETMLAQMQAEFSGINVPANVERRPETIHELLTLASIVEREVQSPEDKTIVAGLFYNRLAIGMALQADSTVNYVTGGNSPSITLEERDIDSPYNTYLYNGLPPGPISNPGLESIKAVLMPATTAYYYFLTTPDGEVIYATTHDEHVVNKNQYLR